MNCSKFLTHMFFFITMSISQSVNAAIQEGGRGLLFGDNHAFSVKAKSGWVLDNQSGVSQGLHMVFYPKNSSWAKSKVIIYGRSVSTSIVPTINDQVKKTIKEFVSNGSENFKATEKSIISLKNNIKARIYLYTGDKFGNYEAVAYVKEFDSINFIVFNARDKETFDNYLDDFYQIIDSYRNLYTSPNNYDLEKLKKFELFSKNTTKTEAGKKYEKKAMQAIGNKMSGILRSCASYLRNKEIPSFSYYVQINRNGVESDTLISPANTIANCFSGLMSNSNYPAHNIENVVLKYVFKFK